jgi:hypothetical protein
VRPCTFWGAPSMARPERPTTTQGAWSTRGVTAVEVSAQFERAAHDPLLPATSGSSRGR